ncbi:MAG: hypothetical protein R3D84_07635 [Paracoccaceae bacterium]
MPSDRTVTRLSLTLALSLGAATVLRAEAPLSAIDWLSQSVREPATLGPGATGSEPGVAAAAQPEAVTVDVIDGLRLDALGLIPAQAAGLPPDLWGVTPTVELARLLRAEEIDTLPALKALIYRLLLAELNPPFDSDSHGVLFLARIDRLLDLGAVDRAAALLELANPTTPEIFRRAFDVALLTGEESRACETLRDLPEVAPTFPARIFCLARNGDWNAAALTLHTAVALDFVDDEEEALLSRFLDPELYEGDGPLPPPQRPSPLVWRMMEAVGEPMPTGALPIAFANAELRPSAGWKAQLEAAERLARAGAIEPNRLLGIYTDRLPAASGGIWDRVEALQRFDTALNAGDPGAVARALPDAWARMTEAEMEVVFAALYAERLSRLPLTGDAARLAFQVGLLSDQYEMAASARKPEDGIEAFLIGLARGNPGGVRPYNRLSGAIQDAFTHSPVPSDLASLSASKRLGEALLLAIDRISRGAAGDLVEVTEGLAFLRSVGLEGAARQTALELLLLERRG